MDDSISTNLKKYLQELSTGSYTFTRRDAAEKLGELSESNEEIVQALIAVEALDSDPNVRNAARQALFSPIHQAILNRNPELAQTAEEKWKRARAQFEQEKVNTYIYNFKRLRKHELQLNFLACGGFIILLGTTIWLETNEMGWFSWLIFFGFFGLVAWQSWRNWRCPACDTWFSSRKAQVSALFCSEPLWCPHCGIKLL